MYNALVADPPWHFKDKLPGQSRGAEKHYSLLSSEDICNFLLPELLPDCTLFLWQVASMQEEAIKVCRAWGFRPYSELVWVKTTTSGKLHFGMGRLLRNSHESCLIGRRSPNAPQPLSRSERSVLFAPYAGHSVKPDAFYGLVERLLPGPYYELFARKPRPGWAQEGDEL